MGFFDFFDFEWLTKLFDSIGLDTVGAPPKENLGGSTIVSGGAGMALTKEPVNLSRLGPNLDMRSSEQISDEYNGTIERKELYEGGVFRGGEDRLAGAARLAELRPVFTDLGTVANLRGGKDEETQITQAALSKLPGGQYINAGLNAAADLLGFSGNAAEISPQQVAFIKAATPQIGIGAALAVAEGRDGSKQIFNDEGDYVRVGGRGLGGPGWSELLDNDY